MAVKSKFHNIKLSYTIQSVRYTQPIPDALFNEALRQKCKDPYYNDYEALMCVILKFARAFALDEYIELVEFEYLDDMGFNVKIVR